MIVHLIMSITRSHHTTRYCYTVRSFCQTKLVLYFSLTECCLTLLPGDLAKSLLSFVSPRVILAIPSSIKVTGGVGGGEESMTLFG